MLLASPLSAAQGQLCHYGKKRVPQHLMCSGARRRFSPNVGCEMMAQRFPIPKKTSRETDPCSTYRMLRVVAVNTIGA